MPDRVKVLLAEDSERDAMLIAHELKRAGFDCEIRRVQTASDFRRELGEFVPDIVVSDIVMPGFSGTAALKICEQSDRELPFIFVSGTIGEDVAVEAMKAGASDYVMKTNLLRLGPAVRRELREADGRRARRRAEAGLRRAQMMAKLAHVITDPDGSMESWSETLPRLAGTEPDHLPRSTRDWMHLLHADDRSKFRDAALQAAASRQPTEVEYRLLRPDERWIHVRQASEPLGETLRPDGRMHWFHTLQDVSEQKRAEEKIARLNRVYAVLSGVNGLIVRVRDRDELFEEACRIAVDDGGFALAWLGVTDRGKTPLRLVAWKGNAEDFIRKLPVTLDDTVTEGRGIARQVVREAKAAFANDIAVDPRVGMREECLAHGLRSLVVLPLAVGGQVAGVMTLYADQTGFFDAGEMRLLLELAGDLSFALEHIEKAEKLDYLAYYDSLTGLANRTLFDERLRQHVANASREKGKLALIVLDIQRFKRINDTLGRQAGDELLRQVAARMKQHALEEERLARLGSDHFAVMIPDVQSEDELARRTEARLDDFFGQSFVVAESELRIACRAGIALFPADAGNAEGLFGNAEAALKKAKASGERYVFYAPQMSERVAEKLSLESKLRQAIEKDEFVLHYQPKVDVKTRSVVGVEALIRWQSRELGLVPPGRFIPLLEETGLILQVGKWALQRASLDHRRWVEGKLKPTRVAVNVSAIQLRQRDFVAIVEQAIIDGIAPTGIDLEITESLAMEDVKTNIERLKAVRGLGVRIAIDDFGTGHSSLGYLTQLPVDSLKIDRSFIAAMNRDPNALTLVSTIISLAHSLGLTVVAEGVEDEEQAKFLSLLRCDEMQGYLFSRPLPEGDLLKLLRG